MKTQWSILLIAVMILAGSAGCAAPTSQPTATPVPATEMPAGQGAQPGIGNQEIVQNMIERLNAGDVEGSLAYFASDAMVYMMGFPPAGIEMYLGKDQIRSIWQDSVNNHFQWEVNIEYAKGDLVNVQAKTWHDFTRQLGVAPLEYEDVYEVIDGKIKTYGTWLTEESLARFKPAFIAAMPPEPTATPFSGTPGSEITVTTAGDTCTTEAPAALKAGEVKVNWAVQDQNNSKYALTLFTLDPDKDILDLMVSTFGLPPTWGEIVLVDELGPGESGTYSFQLEKGPLYLICWSQPPDMPIGNAGPIPVVP